MHYRYDSYGPPYLIWNRYHMVPHMYVWSPHMYYMTLMVHPYLIWNRYLMVSLTLYGTGIAWFPTCMYGLPTCTVSSCLIWLLWSPHTLYGIGFLWSPLPYMEQVSYGPPPHMYDMIFQDSFERGPLLIIMTSLFLIAQQQHCDNVYPKRFSG